ncbi:sphingosine-1-phosphate phosphatase 2 isoform X2 [Leucoraja erinacea]|uniref:sphingosine-1-phosphate phosphatase 2 isoform X2 n=1 Tax=Leucoraja erinaceus TaxID=7782 RepID=UPI0024571743|nr:sphingosine-1-phosphate phosphatase 2 isoform X2 [Leucoraja erinacea]
MMAYFIPSLQDPRLVASFQRVCGLFLQVEDVGSTNNSCGNGAGADSEQVLRTRPSMNGHGRHTAEEGSLHLQGQIVMYLGQASKDIIKWPRPLSPPVVKLETRVDAEYGMPSTHAMAATAISFTFLFATMYRYKYSFALGLMASVLMSTLVSLSRLYTGMHTVLDVICGILLTAVLMGLTYPFWNILDDLQLTSPLTPLIAVVLPFLMSYNYPALDHYSPTRGDTTIILAVASGCTVGFWMNYQYGQTYEPTGPLPFEVPSITLQVALMAIARFLVGISILFATRLIVKTISLKVVCAWFHVPDDMEARKRLEIEVPYKFATYSSIGFVATAVVPLLHQYLNLL